MQSKLIINSGKVVVILAMGGGWAVWVVAWCVKGTLGTGFLRLFDVYRLII